MVLVLSRDIGLNCKEGIGRVTFIYFHARLEDFLHEFLADHVMILGASFLIAQHIYFVQNFQKVGRSQQIIQESEVPIIGKGR